MYDKPIDKVMDHINSTRLPVKVAFASDLANKIPIGNGEVRRVFPQLIRMIEHLTAMRWKDRKVVGENLISELEDYNDIKHFAEKVLGCELPKVRELDRRI